MASARVGTRPVAWLRACHPLPTLAMTSLLAVCGWAVGWRLPPLLALALVVLLGQLSVGWSNDAVDADADRRAGRIEKPTVSGEVTARALGSAAVVALVAAAVGSWWVAGPVGGSFHVVAVLAAWTYNLALSRTAWSFAPYVVAFACVPPFLTVGLDGTAPELWLVLVFALVGVSAHLVNALPDIDTDRRVGLDGAAVRLGARRTALLSWLLLGVASLVLGLGLRERATVLAAVPLLVWAVGWVVGARVPGRAAQFRALLACVAVDAVLLVVALA